MTIIETLAEDVKYIPTAINGNSAFAESAFDTEGVSNRNGKLHKQAPAASEKPTAKIHFLSRTLARKHGINAAAVLAGFALKLKDHKHNPWNGRYWYYDPFETLAKERWPYLAANTIWEITEYLSKEKLLIKDRHNKLSFDRTTWFAMEDDAVNKALHDTVWFDVAVARKLGIPAALVYHNLRYHLREILKEDPKCLIPYHKLSPTQLSRDLPMSLSTVKRAIKDLGDAKWMIQHPSKKTTFTISDARDIHGNGSKPNENGSNPNGSNKSRKGSLASKNGSYLNANGSNPSDNTLYETDEKPFRNQSETDGCVFECHVLKERKHELNDGIISQGDLNSLLIKDHDSELDSSFNNESDPVHVITAPATETVGTDTEIEVDSMVDGEIYSFQTIRSRNKRLVPYIDQWNEDLVNSYCEEVQQLMSDFVDKHLELFDHPRFHQIENVDDAVEFLHPKLVTFLESTMEAQERQGVSARNAWSLYYYPVMEAFVGAVHLDDPSRADQFHTFKRLGNLTMEASMLLENQKDKMVSISTETKVEVFRRQVKCLNVVGWAVEPPYPHHFETRKKNAVNLSGEGLEAITRIFESNPKITVKQILNVLKRCVWLRYSEKTPEGFDPNWHARQGNNVEKFCRWIGSIVNELDMFDVCPVSCD